MTKVLLSKSRFVSGMQCEKKLYFDLYRKDLKPELSVQQEALFATGHEIGHLAQQVYPGGKDATPDSYLDFSEAIDNTKQWIKDGVSTIYEAAFEYEGFLAALDILHFNGNSLLAIEVKSSTSVKDYQINDASFQYWLMSKAGYQPNKFYIMHINNKFVKDGEINLNELFIKTDITDIVKKRQEGISEDIERLRNVVNNQENEPKVAIGKHCNSPFECDYIHHCWHDIPEDSVFDLIQPRGRDWKLYNEGILRIADIPKDCKLNMRQSLQVDAVRNNNSHIDVKELKKFINNSHYPLCFLDFETIASAVPLLDGTSPFQQIPFQYSLHVIKGAGAELQHFEFLAEPNSFQTTSKKNPCELLLEQLLEDMPISGTIIAYNACFEKNVLYRLSLMFPEYKRFVSNLLSRFVDLLIPFRSGWYYKPEMKNSVSIKSVLPAIAPQFAYNDLVVNNGYMASEIFLSMVKNNFNEDKETKRKELLTYCERDTMGMVVIWDELLRAIK